MGKESGNRGDDDAKTDPARPRCNQRRSHRNRQDCISAMFLGAELGGCRLPVDAARGPPLDKIWWLLL